MKIFHLRSPGMPSSPGRRAGIHRAASNPDPLDPGAFPGGHAVAVAPNSRELPNVQPIGKTMTRRVLRGVGVCRALVFLAGLAAVVQAYPPAPHHLFLGLVRNEFGDPVDVEDARIILETLSGSMQSTRIVPGLVTGGNYKLKVPMDAGITEDLYQPTALRPTVPFVIRVKIGGSIYLPIEMVGDLSRMGEPGETTWLNLTLGEDADGDGLPDAWERALLRPGQTLDDINGHDDTDGDGLSNLQEYISGNYAFDDRDGFGLSIVQVIGDTAVMEFQAIRGRTYTVYGSAALKDWSEVGFRVLGDDTGEEAPLRFRYYADDVRNVRIAVPPRQDSPGMHFYKLMVQ